MVWMISLKWFEVFADKPGHLRRVDFEFYFVFNIFLSGSDL